MTNKNNLTKDFMKKIEWINNFKLMEDLMPNLFHHKLDLEDCFILRKDETEQTLSKLSKEYISIKEVEKFIKEFDIEYHVMLDSEEWGELKKQLLEKG